jgi:hypothetical protein
MTGNGFNNARLGLGLKGMIGAFSFEEATSAPQLLFQRAAFHSDCNNGLDGVFRQPATHVLQTILKEENNRLAKALLCFVHCLSLTVGTRQFGAHCPKTSLGRSLDNCGKLVLHGFFITLHILWNKPRAEAGGRRSVVR